jgi:hypothetical protein
MKITRKTQREKTILLPVFGESGDHLVKTRNECPIRGRKNIKLIIITISRWQVEVVCRLISWQIFDASCGMWSLQMRKMSVNVTKVGIMIRMTEGGPTVAIVRIWILWARRIHLLSRTGRSDDVVRWALLCVNWWTFLQQDYEFSTKTGSLGFRLNILPILQKDNSNQDKRITINERKIPKTFLLHKLFVRSSFN